MGSIYPETGSDGFAKDHISWKEWMSGSQEIYNAPADLIRTQSLLKALFLKWGNPGVQVSIHSFF